MLTEWSYLFTVNIMRSCVAFLVFFTVLNSMHSDIWVWQIVKWHAAQCIVFYCLYLFFKEGSLKIQGIQNPRVTINSSQEEHWEPELGQLSLNSYHVRFIIAVTLSSFSHINLPIAKVKVHSVFIFDPKSILSTYENMKWCS